MDQVTRLNIKDFIGETMCQRYTYAYPVLRLLVARAAYGVEEDQQIYGLLFSNNGPTLSEARSMRGRLEYISRLPMYLKNKMSGRSDTSDKILVSDTLLLSDRYLFYQQECVNDERIAGLSLIFNHYSIKGHKRVKYNRSVNLGKYVVDPEIIRITLKLYSLIKKAYDDKIRCPEISGYADEVKLLDELISARVAQIKHELSKNKIRQYITCNQYRVEEVVIIEACRALGIVTKEWSHHSMCTFDIHLYETSDDSFISNIENCYIYTDYYCCWNEGDVKWLRKHGHVEPVFDQNIQYIVAGSPEINEKKQELTRDRYQNVKYICYMVLTYGLELDSDEVDKDHHMVLGELYKLAQSSGYKVLVRYHPAEYEHRLACDKELYSQYGFEVIDNTRDALEQALLKSTICFGCGSSSLVLAYNYGVKTYAIELKDRGEYDYDGTCITQISPEEISSVSIDEEMPRPLVDSMNTELLYQA